MVLFRLGKINRGEKDDKDKEKGDADKPEVVASGGGNAPVAAAMPVASDNGSRGAVGVPAASQVGLSVNDFISKTKNQQRQGLKPSGPELIAYSRYLGIDPVADHDLLWIAVEALEAPLPSDWTEHFDSNDRVFYYNATMRVSSWTHPLEHIYRETYKTIVNFRNANMAPQERGEKLHQLQLEVKQMEYDVHKEIAQWSEHTDDQGNHFYFNRDERQSTWTDPRPAKCQILYLRMKMLRLLQSGSGATPGFSDSKVDLSRFSNLGNTDFDDPALKRPKVGGHGRSGEGGGGGGSWNQPEDDNMKGGLEPRQSSTSDIGSDRGSDSDDEGPRRAKKKKKKKKKHKERSRDQPPPASPPPRPGAAGPAGMRSSQSEPSVGSKPLGEVQPEGPFELGAFERPAEAAWNRAGDQGPEGLSTVGRARVKAGIRLEPIPAPVGPGAGEGNEEMHRPGKGVRNSASVPALQP